LERQPFLGSPLGDNKFILCRGRELTNLGTIISQARSAFTITSFETPPECDTQRVEALAKFIPAFAADRALRASCADMTYDTRSTLHANLLTARHQQVLDLGLSNAETCKKKDPLREGTTADSTHDQSSNLKSVVQGMGVGLVLTVRVTVSHQAVMLLNRPLTLTARTPDRRIRTEHWRPLDR
jgi:hypothetical protein